MAQGDGSITEIKQPKGKSYSPKREETMVRDPCEHLGSVRLRDIAPQTIETVYARIREQKVEARGKCSGTTMNMYHKLLKMVLSKAVDYELVLRNPVDRVKAPRCETSASTPRP